MTYVHPDGCAGCQRARRTIALPFEWQERFVMRLCAGCVVGLLLARPSRLLARWARRLPGGTNPPGP